MSSCVLGVDVGGANLKAATVDGRGFQRSFALWKQPDRLVDELVALIEAAPDSNRMAVTMTGELCDCFENRSDGVQFILDAVERASDGRTVRVWTTAGKFVDIREARRIPYQVASANWLATGTLAGRIVSEEPGLFVDVGSTTTDVLPIIDGRPIPFGRTDAERLAARELVYTGVRRTPVCAVLGFCGAAEWFATMHDAYVALGNLPENPNDCDTADGRPAIRRNCLARLARMRGADLSQIAETEIVALAKALVAAQVAAVDEACEAAIARLHAEPAVVIGAGSGEFLIGKLLRDRPNLKRLSFSSRWSIEASTAACAFAVAVLAAEEADRGER